MRRLFAIIPSSIISNLVLHISAQRFALLARRVTQCAIATRISNYVKFFGCVRRSRVQCTLCSAALWLRVIHKLKRSNLKPCFSMPLKRPKMKRFPDRHSPGIKIKKEPITQITKLPSCIAHVFLFFRLARCRRTVFALGACGTPNTIEKLPRLPHVSCTQGLARDNFGGKNY